MPVMCEKRSSCEHPESSGTNIVMRGPIVCQFCVRRYRYKNCKKNEAKFCGF